MDMMTWVEFNKYTFACVCLCACSIYKMFNFMNLRESCPFTTLSIHTFSVPSTIDAYYCKGIMSGDLCNDLYEVVFLSIYSAIPLRLMFLFNLMMFKCECQVNNLGCASMKV